MEQTHVSDESQEQEQQPAQQVAIRVLRLGQWGGEAKYNTDVPDEIIKEALRWLESGDHTALTPDVAAFVLAQHRAILRELDAKGKALFSARERITKDARDINALLANAGRCTEAYDMGYRMGRYLEIDRCAETIQQIADAGTPEPDAIGESKP